MAGLFFVWFHSHSTATTKLSINISVNCFHPVHWATSISSYQSFEPDIFIEKPCDHCPCRLKCTWNYRVKTPLRKNDEYNHTAVVDTWTKELDIIKEKETETQK